MLPLEQDVLQAIMTELINSIIVRSGAYIGSGCNLVAPIEIGTNATIVRFNYYRKCLFKLLNNM